METFFDQYGAMVVIASALVSLVSIVIAVMNRVKVRALDARWTRVLEGSDGHSLESVLKDHVVRVHSFSSRVDDAAGRIALLESKMETTKRFIGVVRYDAFEDMGGSQSFAVALFDDNGDGAVLTSQVGRTDCRVYAKELRAGKSDRELSAEEVRAINTAAKSRPMEESRR